MLNTNTVGTREFLFKRGHVTEITGCTKKRPSGMTAYTLYDTKYNGADLYNSLALSMRWAHEIYVTVAVTDLSVSVVVKFYVKRVGKMPVKILKSIHENYKPKNLGVKLLCVGESILRHTPVDDQLFVEPKDINGLVNFLKILDTNSKHIFAEPSQRKAYIG